MKSVFLVKTPLQLLNAIEARHHYELKKQDCVVILMADRKSQKQLRNLAQAVDEWGDVLDLNDAPLLFLDPLKNVNADSLFNNFWKLKIFNRSIFYVHRLNRISKCLGEVEYFFVGYARYVYMKHLVNITPHRKIVSLDDGNATLELAKERGFSPNNIKSLPLKKKIKLFLRKYIQGLNSNEFSRLEFFTIYNIDLDRKDSLVKHNFSYLKSRIENISRTEEVYFIGSPLSETGIVSKSSLLENLKRVKSYYKGKNIVYISHRRESEINLKEISRELGMKVIQFEYPIEYQLAMKGPRPVVLASFISSALDSCSLIFGDTMRVVAFRLDLVDSPRQDEINSIYDSYESDNNSKVVVESNY